MGCLLSHVHATQYGWNFLSAGQRLYDVNPAFLVKRIGQMLPVAHRPSVDEHREMPTQRTLIVKDVASQARLLDKDGLERVADRARVDLALGRGDMPLNRSREEEVRHDEVTAWEWPCP
jgi:hypothetical protein